MLKLRCFALIALLFSALAAEAALVLVPKWERFERDFKSARNYSNPFQDITLAVVFTSPSGQSKIVNAFWHGGKSWKVRFSPNEIGKWIYTSVCSDSSNKGLAEISGSFTCTAPQNRNRFSKHGPLQVSGDGRFLHHEDGTPYFWLADTAWNGALLSSPEEWRHYIDIRLRQGFTAVQWVATQWRAAPQGNRTKTLAFTGREKIQINTQFFQDLDRKHDALNEAGLLSVPVLLWAIPAGSNPKINPGVDLPEDQAILLAKYMVARWGANDVAYFLGGDGDYRGEKAEKWKRIGRAVFGDSGALATMHPGGMHWVLNEFQGERWFKFYGYQSGHGDDDRTLQWLASGPPATDWSKRPYRPFINLEPPYEDHISYQSKKRISPHQVRRASYWSLLVAPPAGVTYGGHGIWGWDDGTKDPADHPGTGIPKPWREALRLPGAEQMRHLASLYNSVAFWRLRPAPKLVAQQSAVPAEFIAAAKTVDNSTALIYTPVGATIKLTAAEMPRKAQATWFNPRTGDRLAAEGSGTFQTPDKEDWVLILKAQ